MPNERRLAVTTDRLSAFDRVLTLIPYKGQVLNQLAAYWFGRLGDIIPHHLLAVPDPNISLVQECSPLPVEVVVRGFITGVTSTSLWTRYAQGERVIYGYSFPDGLKKNDRLPKPLITPTTKAAEGQHDEALTCDEVTRLGLLDQDTWTRVQAAALEIFRRGQQVAENAGFLLVDTKYEFGRSSDGTIMLIDEVHTPDSSRFWNAENYQAMQRTEESPSHWDKEYVRLWYASKGYRGEGPAPTLPEHVVAEAAHRYIGLFEGLTGKMFEPADSPPGPRIAQVVRSYLR